MTLYARLLSKLANLLMKNPHSKKQAFSLIELAIALVIIAGLISVVIGASTLKRNTEMRRIVDDVEKIRSAVINFKNIYDAYPGDFSKASTIWSSCADSTTYSTTCSGDGNGYVNATESTLGQTGESVYMYEHLYHAGLLEKQYEGNNNSDSSYYEVTKNNSYNREFDSNFIYFAVWPASSTSTNYIELRLSGICNGSSCGGGNDGKPLASAFKVETAYFLDQKLDDAVYDSGKLLTIIGGNFSENSDSDCDYSSNLTVVTPYCQIKLELVKNL